MFYEGCKRASPKFESFLSLLSFFFKRGFPVNGFRGNYFTKSLRGSGSIFWKTQRAAHSTQRLFSYLIAFISFYIRIYTNPHTRKLHSLPSPLLHSGLSSYEKDSRLYGGTSMPGTLQQNISAQQGH